MNENEKVIPNAVILIVAFGEKQKEFTLVEPLESEKFVGINLKKMTIEYFDKDENKDFPSLRLEKMTEASSITTSFHDEYGNCCEPEYSWTLGYGLAVSRGNFHVIVHVKAIRYKSGYTNFWNKCIFTSEEVANYLTRMNRQQIALQVIHDNNKPRTIAVSKDSAISPSGGHTTDVEIIVDFIQDSYMNLIVDQIKKEEGIIQLRNSLDPQKTILKKGERTSMATTDNKNTEIIFVDFFPKFTLHEWNL
jgi:hypothetical protein